MAAHSSSIATGTSSACRSRRNAASCRSTPASRTAATTITASRQTLRNSRSATIRRETTSHGLHRAHRWRYAAADHAEVSFVLAWLVSRRKDARVRRTAQRRIRYLCDSGRGRRRDAADDCEGPRRRPGVFTGWKVYLLQLRAHAATCRSGA